ncbi:MAG: hypothetical protein ACYDH6_17570 [Acidimicrobiales bacterium]
MKGTVHGRGGIGTSYVSPVGGTVDINAAGGTFEWTMHIVQDPESTVPGGGGTAGDNTKATGTLPETTTTVEGETTTSVVVNMRDVTATGTGTAAGSTFTLTVTGKLKGPPKPCTGNGTWKVVINGKTVADGTWTIP